MSKEIKLGTKKYPYCSNRTCEDFECIRHWNYAPWDVLIMREDYEPNSKGICKNKLK